MATKKKTATAKTPVHQWTNDDGEVLFLRFSNNDGKAHGGFQHPLKIGATVTAPDWNPQPVCGGGIHGWPWGIGLGSGKDPDWNALWQVYGVSNLDEISSEIDGQPKCKFRAGILRFAGDWHAAMLFVLEGQKAWVEHFADNASSITGYRSASSLTGDRSASSLTGYMSASSLTGDNSASSLTGDRSASSLTGDRSASSLTGDNSASSATGKASAAVATGRDSKARAGEFGCIALAWWNEKKGRFEMRCAETGCGDGSDGKLQAHVWYALDSEGRFIETVQD